MVSKTVDPLAIVAGVAHPAMPTGGTTGAPGPTHRRTYRPPTANNVGPPKILQNDRHTKPERAASPPPHKRLIANLQQQVELLNAENEALRTAHAKGGAAPAAAAPAAAAADENSISSFEKYRLSSLDALAKDEKAKLVAELQRVRTRAATSQQELTAEAVGLQSALEQKNVVEKSLRAELAVTAQKLKELTAFSEDADSHVRLLNSEIAELKKELERGVEREEGLRKQLGSEQLRTTRLQSKVLEHAGSAGTILSQRKEAEAEAEKAGVTLRLAQIELERETRARAEADERRDFLVRENAQLKGAMNELTVTTEALANEMTRMRRENETNRLANAMAKYMVRKMHTKELLALEARDQMTKRLEGMHADRVKELQRSDLLESQLAQEKQRASIVADHYAQQEADAAQLTAENRLLLERVERLAEANQSHKEELDARGQRLAELEAEVASTREQANIVAALRGLRVDSLADMSRSNMAFASSIDGLLKALPKLESASALHFDAKPPPS